VLDIYSSVTAANAHAVTLLYVFTLVQMSTDPKAPHKHGNHVQFMEHVILPYKNANKEVLKVRLTSLYSHP
jgi:hypothetical protein